MAKFGIYRVENSAYDTPYSEVDIYDVLIEEGVYRFRDRFGRTEAAFPTRHFYIVRLEG